MGVFNMNQEYKPYRYRPFVDLWERTQFLWLGIVLCISFLCLNEVKIQDKKRSESQARWIKAFVSGALHERLSLNSSSSIHNGPFTNQWMWNTTVPAGDIYVTNVYPDFHFHTLRAYGFYQSESNLVHAIWGGTNIFTITNANLNDLK